MINCLTLKNFRNFSNSKYNFSRGINLIIGENGKGKTNILEAISVLCGKNHLFNIPFKNFCSLEQDVFFVSGDFYFEEENIHLINSISYNKVENKKKYITNKKNTTQTIFYNNSLKVTLFSPMEMNMMYLSPSLRRDFLHNILINSYKIYNNLYKNFTNILRNRNKILKNINEGNSNINELIFWDKQYIDICIKLYKYIDSLIRYIKVEIKIFDKYLGGKIKNIDFIYITKVNFDNTEESIKDYLEKNKQREIILKRTCIGPHVDDFDILLDGISLINFASRGETKSIILGLKFLEIEFIKQKTNKNPLLLIDDLLSELDIIHKNILLKKISNYQAIITSINDLGLDNINIIKL